NAKSLPCSRDPRRYLLEKVGRMQPGSSPPLLQAAVAVAIGLVMGLEREHHEVAEGEIEIRLGMRTFALLALLGWASAFTGIPWLPFAALLASGIVIATQYFRAAGSDPGLTTEIAALVAVVVGMVVRVSLLVGATVGLGATVLLIAKPWVRAYVPRLRRV